MRPAAEIALPLWEWVDGFNSEPREERLEIYAVPEADCTVARVLVDVDVQSSPTIRAAMFRVLRQQKPKRLILDLRRVRRIDSAGVASLLEVWSRARRGAHLILAGLNETIVHMLQLNRVERLFEVKATVEEALALC